MKKSGLLIVVLLLAVLLAGLIICLSFASNKEPSRVKLVSGGKEAYGSSPTVSKDRVC
jgi:hypothetical protein